MTGISQKTKGLVLLIFGMTAILFSGCTKYSLQTGDPIFNDDAFQNCQTRVFGMMEDRWKLEKTMDHDLLDFQETVEEMLVLRKQALTLARAYGKHKKLGEAVPAAILDQIKQGMKQSLQTTDKIAQFVSQNECWIKLDDGVLKKTKHSPLDPGIRLKGVMMALSGTLLLYDFYLSTVTVITEDNALRNFLNQSDIGYGIKRNQLSEITDAYLSISNLLYLQETVSFYNKKIEQVSKKRQRDTLFQYMKLFIEQSPTYEIFQKRQSDKLIGKRFNQRVRSVTDNLEYLNRQGMSGVSSVFGNTAGLVETRKGKLYDNPLLVEQIKKKLRAGDILLEKTPFRLTDQMIPGHWGHAAIWIGTKAELKQLNIWNHPVVQKYHDEISAERLVVEALRDGVQMNPLAQFMNIDDMGLLRNPIINEKDLADHIIRTLRQVGKEYDFNFDVESTDKIVCSELIYQAYTDISWPTQKIAGRYTISPDNIAQKAIGNGPLELVFFFHDGKRIDQDALSLMKKLMRAEHTK